MRPPRLARLLLLVPILAVWAACPVTTDRDANDPAYLCPRMVDRCRECLANDPGFKEADCDGKDGAIRERCRGKANARPAWLEQLKAALAQQTCSGFAEEI